MVATRAVNPKRIKMLLCAISLVFGKAVLWKPGVYFPHQPIPGDLGEDAGCRNRERAPVAFHNPIMRPRKTTHWQTVDQAMIRHRAQTCHRPLHRQMGGTQNVESINLRSRGHGYRPDHTRVRSQDLIERLTLGRAELFRVVQSKADKIRRQNHCGGGHRTRQGPASGLIHPGDPGQAAGVQCVFEGKVGHAEVGMGGDESAEGATVSRSVRTKHPELPERVAVLCSPLGPAHPDPVRLHRRELDFLGASTAVIFLIDDLPRLAVERHLDRV